MSKKRKDGAQSVGTGPSALTHNPFAALLGKAVQAPAVGDESRAGQPPSARRPAPERAPQPEPSAATRPHSELSTRPTAEAPARKVPDAPPVAAHSKPKARGRLVLRRETKHRGGKAVVVVTGLAQCRDLDEASIERLAKDLKQALGCGGTVEREGPETSIVLQGDRPAKVAELLRAQNFRVDGVTS